MVQDSKIRFLCERKPKSNMNFLGGMDYPSVAIGLLTGITCGVCLGWAIRGRLLRALKTSSPSSISSFQSSDSGILGPDCKLMLIVRDDLKMGKGKAAAQCAHASVIAYQQVQSNTTLLNLWRLCGQRKVVLKVHDEDSLLDLANKARKAGLLTSLVCDAGHTQVAAGTKTVLGLGPAPGELLGPITGHLKLY